MGKDVRRESLSSLCVYKEHAWIYTHIVKRVVLEEFHATKDLINLFTRKPILLAAFITPSFCFHPVALTLSFPFFYSPYPLAHSFINDPTVKSAAGVGVPYSSPSLTATAYFHTWASAATCVTASPIPSQFLIETPVPTQESKVSWKVGQSPRNNALKYYFSHRA